MEDKLVFVIDDTNERTMEDLEAFEATLDPDVVSETKAELAALFSNYRNQGA